MFKLGGYFVEILLYHKYCFHFRNNSEDTRRS